MKTYLMVRLRLILFLLVASVVTKLNAQNLYISPNGDDHNSGTISSPLASLQAAANVIAIGDTVFIREGLYHDELVLNKVNSTEEAPIVFKSYANETVVFDGTVDLDSIKVPGTSWELATDSFPGTNTIYKLTLEEDIWQLFVRQPEFMELPNAVKGELAEYRMQVVARWPDKYTNPTDPLQRKPNSPEAAPNTWWDFETSYAYASHVETNHTVLVNNTSRYNLAATGLSFAGGTAVVSAIKQGPANQLLKILEHEAGSNKMIHSGLPEEHEIYEPGSIHGPSYFVQHLKALNKAGEWYYLPETKTVYLWPEGNIDPNTLKIRGKNQTYAVNFDNCSNITFDGISLFATTMKLDGDHICFKNGVVSYPDMPKTLLGIYEETVPAIEASKCNYFSFTNSISEYSMAHLVETNKTGAYFENNYFHNLGIQGTGTTGCFMGMNTFIYNTLETIGHRAAVKANSNPPEGRIQSWNMMSGWGFLYANDGVGIQTNQAFSVNSVRSHNWFIQSDKPGHRYDGPDEGKGFPTLGLSHHLVGYKTMSVSTNIKGDYNQVYNYLGIESLNENGDIAIRFNIDTGEGNAHTIMRNCAADGINVGKWDPLPCINSNNWDASEMGGSMSEFHPEAKIFDFRAREGAPLINAGYEVEGITDGFLGDAPDIGAYEWGDDKYWIPGYKGTKTSFPIPQDGIKNMSVDRDLIFKQAYRCDSAIVYFGTAKDAVENATWASAVEAGTSNIDGGTVIKIPLGQGRNIVTPTILKGNPKNYDPSPYLLIDDPTQVLLDNSTYYWRADAVDNEGNVSKGDVWEFSTGDISFLTEFNVFVPNDDDQPTNEDVTIVLDGNEYRTNGNGVLTGVRLPAGDHSYSIEKYGYNTITGMITLNSDTLVTDTLSYAICEVTVKVVDDETEEGIPNAVVVFDGEQYIANEFGEFTINDVIFSDYVINASAPEYKENEAQEIEVASDMNIVIQLTYDYKAVSLQVLDISSNLPVYNVSVITDREFKITNNTGEVVMEKVPKKWWKFSTSHSLYFSFNDSVFVEADTSIVVRITKKLADITFVVNDISGSLEGAVATIDYENSKTDSQGLVVFNNLRSRNEYIFSVSKPGYKTFTDTLYIEKDTIVSVMMDYATGIADGLAKNGALVYPNPTNSMLYVENYQPSSKLEIINPEGKVILRKMLSGGKFELDVSNFNAGIYFLSIRNKSEIKNVKVVIN